MSSAPPAAAPAASSTPSTTTATTEANEVELRNQLRKLLKDLTRREPLDLTYKHLLFDGVVTPRRPTLAKDKLYKHVGANLRKSVTQFAEHPWDKIAQREPLDETEMRAAFTLRENKKHEQEALLQATLAATNPPNYAARKRKLEGMAMTLQRKKPKKHKPSKAAVADATTRAANNEEEERRRAEYQRQLQQQKREAARLRRLEEERQQKEERLARMQESPQVKLARYCQPVFNKLWDMEFDLLQKTNPFRIVIDENNCAAMGAPDYMDIIKKPMNLTWIQAKLKEAKYETLPEFFADIELVLSNAVLYNSDPNNPYHLAAKEMRQVFRKEGKELYQQLQKHARHEI
jgi:flagellar biosynthesis GTPase FlhF